MCPSKPKTIPVIVLEHLIVAKFEQTQTKFGLQLTFYEQYFFNYIWLVILSLKLKISFGFLVLFLLILLNRLI